ncbi:MAG: hypothetical protein RMM58_13835 [Chloroflexota bacterium]|nr:hypothetical protein [Chloroflexota bacterium]
MRRLHLRLRRSALAENGLLLGWRALLGALAAAVLALPAAAQPPGLTMTLIAEGSQRALPAGPLVWQGSEHVILPGAPPLVVGEDAGFTWVVEGTAQIDVAGQPAVIAPAGTAIAAASGARRIVRGLAPTGTVIWMLGLGGPRPSAVQVPPRLLFQSAPMLPPSDQGVVFQMWQIDLDGPGELAGGARAGTVTLVVREGNVLVRVADGSAVLRRGQVTAVAADSRPWLIPLGGRPARLVALTLLAAAATASEVSAAPASPGRSGALALLSAPARAPRRLLGARGAARVSRGSAGGSSAGEERLLGPQGGRAALLRATAIPPAPSALRCR